MLRYCPCDYMSDWFPSSDPQVTVVNHCCLSPRHSTARPSFIWVVLISTLLSVMVLPLGWCYYTGTEWCYYTWSDDTRIRYCEQLVRARHNENRLSTCRLDDTRVLYLLDLGYFRPLWISDILGQMLLPILLECLMMVLVNEDTRIRHMVVFGIKDSNQYLEKMNTTTRVIIIQDTMIEW